MMRIPMFALGTVLLSVGFSNQIIAQGGGGGGGGILRGHVADTAGTPLPRTGISIEAVGASATTNDRGDYEIRGVPVGTYTARARRLGYVAQLARVTISDAQPTQHDFVMRPQPIGLEPVSVVVGSRARHTAANELAVPVDVFPAELIEKQGTTETGQILQQLAPSVNFPHQSVTDAGDIVRPFTLRGLSPDQTLVLMNGWRQHQTALVNNFTYGMGAGSSGVDLNTIPQSAIDRIEVLRDGASAQYGSDAIAGVVNIVTREGEFTPFIAADAGRYATGNYRGDGTTVDVNGGWGLKLGAGSLSLFGEYLDRQPTNRAYADPFENAGTGIADSVNSTGQVVIKRNPVAQPNHHWGDGLERDAMTLGNLRLPLNTAGTSEIYAFGGYSFRQGTGNPYRRCAATCASFVTDRAWPQIYPLGFLPEFAPHVTDYSATGGWRGAVSGWSLDVGASFGHNHFDYDLRNTLNTSLGPCLDPKAPCSPTGVANQTSFYAGRLLREEFITAANVSKSLDVGLRAPVDLAIGAAFRRERYEIGEGDSASWIQGKHLAPAGDSAVAGSQGFPGFSPQDVRDNHRTNVGAYVDAESALLSQLLADAAVRFEHYSDFGSRVTEKLALRFQPSRQLTLRAAASTGFRAPGISQEYFRHVATNVIAGVPLQVIIAPVNDTVARLLGSKPLRDETSVNLSGGAAFSPSSDVTLTADYFYIKIDHRVMLTGTFADSATLAYLASNGEPGFGGVQYFTNGLDTRTQGVDLTANARVPAVRVGALDLTAAVNWTKNEITHVDALPPVLKRTGESGLIDTVTWIGITEERPDWRGTLTGLYSLNRLHSLARASYYGKFSSAQPGYCNLCRERYGAKTLVDAEVGYRFTGVDLSIGVRNLFDVYPDKPSSNVVVDASGDHAKDFNNNFGTFPWAAASPFGYNGRYIYTRASILLIR